ncbi:PTTG1 protein, partial [Alcedo cyanopectus]|nr:PTTG1 protein [Ceyx cyanopectus]
MATLIFVERENEEVGAVKNRGRLPSAPAKAFSERLQVKTPLPKKSLSALPAKPQSVRKALGNVNITERLVSKSEKKRWTPQPCPASQISEKTTGLGSSDAVAEEDWPEIEQMFPFDPRDFESFDLPEEDKISNLKLCGVPLMVYDRTYDRRVIMAPSPTKTERRSWESNLQQSNADFLATLDEIIDMPPPLDY